jgi:transcription initiation factor IIF auxiliary subunit
MAATKRLKIEQNQKYYGDDWWSWSVWIDGPEEELSNVTKVEYTLHPTFSKPVRTITTRRNQFKLSTEGWGTFPIYARVFKKDGSIRRLQHNLRLSYPPNEEPSK